MLLPYLAQLDKERLNVWHKLRAFKNNFVLAGGTALMMQIGHRLSYDFDCFSEKRIPDNFLKKLAKLFDNQINVEVNNNEFLLVKTKKDIKIDFVYHPFPILKPPIKTDSLDLFHLDDLAANKANVIGRRGQWRDYVDLFFLLKTELYSLEKITNLAGKKFGIEFNDRLFLQQLIYFDDLVLSKTKFLKKNYTDKQIKQELETQVANFVKRKLNK